MAPKRVPLKIAIADYPHTAALLDGRVEIEGVAAEFIRVIPQIAAFRRMVRDIEFDVCELAPTTHLIARARGAPYVALPIFVMRRFHHGGLLIRPDADIHHPRDLEGKKVGVRAWSVTTGVWTRAILADDYGLDLSRVTWIVDDEEHVRELTLPPNVIHAPAGRSLVEMMDAGDIVAGFDGNAGIGRAGDPATSWKQVAAPTYPELFADANALEAAWHARTGIYPMHGTIVVKESVLAEHPFIARALYDAFERAKAAWLPQFTSGAADTATDRKYRALSRIVGDDPLPYGMEANARTIEALADIAHRQALTPTRLPIEDCFADPLAT